MTSSTQYVAVGLARFLPEIKRYLILFDKVAVVYGDSDWMFRDKDPSLAADIDWLENKGLVFRSNVFLNRECGFKFEVDEYAKRGKRIIVHVLDERTMPLHKIQEIRETHMGMEFMVRFGGKTVGYIMSSMDDLSCRWEARRLAQSLNVQTVSLSPPVPEVSELLGVDSSPGHVVRVVLKDMPEPSDTTSLEQILEFRQDPESTKRMYEFRRWIKKMMSKELPASEITEELEWLAHKYEEHMHFHHMKTNKGALEIVVTTAAEMAENLVKIKWGKLAKMPFAISHKKIDLLEAEMKAPGREVAYVVQARKTFNSV